MRSVAPDDVPDLFGLGSATLRWALVAFAVVYVAVSVGAGWQIRSPWRWAGLLCGFVLFTLAIGLVVRTGGSRGSTDAAVVATAASVGGIAISLWSLPVATYQTVQSSSPVSAMTIAMAMLALHRRTLIAWSGAVCCSAVAMAWGESVGFGLGTGAQTTFFSYPVMIMATLFVLVALPLEDRIRMLRERAIAQASTEAATAAGAAERNRQRRRLDRRARPILQQIVERHEFTSAEVANARLTEAQLRDGIRAQAWESEEVREAVWRARRRGVSVLLLDDGAAGPATDSAVGRQLRDVLVDELNAVDGGQLTARVLPPGRALLASIVVNEDPRFRRVECGVDGAVAVHTGSLD